MIRSVAFLRRLARLASVLPLAILAGACSDGATPGSGAGGGGGSGGGVNDDTTPPTVASTYPLSDAMGESTIPVITATFSEEMAAATLTSMSFQLAQGPVIVPGVVTYFNNTTTFVPTGDLALSTTYTATITTAATDLAGNELAEVYTWSFTTDATAPIGPAPVLLGAAGQFVILAQAAISNVPTSVITGDVGLSPAAASYITGFSLTKAGTHWTSPQVIGGVFAADNDPPTPIDLTTAVSDMHAAYTDAAGRSTPTFLDLAGGNIGGQTLVPGLYTWTSSVTIPTDVTIAGAPNDIWIFQITGDLMTSAATKMTLSGGARAKNVFWQVAGEVVLGTASHAEGIILSKTAVNLGTGASIDGRLMAQTAVDIASATVTAP